MAYYDISTPEGRAAAAAAYDNTLGTSTTWTSRHGDAPSQPQAYWPDGTPMTDADFENIRKYGTYSADEDARRFEVGQSNIVANRQQTALEHADQVRQARALLKQRQYEFNQNFGLDTQKFGESQRQFNVGNATDLLKYGGTLRGARDFVQGDMVAQGATTLSPWIASLRTGQPVAYGGGTATGVNPTPLTVGTLANAMSGGDNGVAPPTPSGVGSVARPASTDAYGRPSLSPGVQQAVDAVSDIAKAGIANRPLGWWENQTQGQREAYTSASDYLGRDTRSDLEYLRRSRPGQGSATAA